MNIKELRTKHGLTLKELADKMEVSVATVSRWEKAPEKLKQETYQKLTEPLNTAISQQKEKQQGEPKGIEKSKPQKYTLYSWKEENGYRGYSNTSFPTDRPYSDPKIEYR